tara:strand:+ start:231 stop:536 length:306 start_codon:yes stop_codon:yes gene_type:complete
MFNPKITEGQWGVVYNGDYQLEIKQPPINKRGDRVCKRLCNFNTIDVTDDMRAIAAVPELLEVYRAAYESIMYNIEVGGEHGLSPLEMKLYYKIKKLEKIK